MGEILEFIPRDCTAKGTNVDAFPQQSRIRQYFFAEEWERMKLLRQLPRFFHRSVVLLYPGCGVDVLGPLLYLEHLFPKLEKVCCLFVDKDNTLAMIKTILDDVGVWFAAEKQRIRFYWKRIPVDLYFNEADIRNVLPALPSIDIYFEKAFRIIRKEWIHYEETIMNKLNQGGVLISDSGFEDVSGLRKIGVPPELSAYREMVVGVKEHG